MGRRPMMRGKMPVDSKPAEKAVEADAGAAEKAVEVDAGAEKQDPRVH